jgi:hypothetical protein
MDAAAGDWFKLSEGDFESRNGSMKDEIRFLLGNQVVQRSVDFATAQLAEASEFAQVFAHLCRVIVDAAYEIQPGLGCR